MAGGHIINDYIVINCTNPDIDPNNKSLHFLTNVGRHHKCMKDVISEHVDHVYTTEFNTWYLSTFFHADSSKFISVPLHRKKQVKCRGKRITFEFLDANHCAGSVMILFKGDFGSYLYTGNCRYSPEMLDYRSLKPYTKGNKELDRLYINGAFKKLGYNFPPKAVVIKQITDFIRNRKEDTMYVCCRQLGKEDILVAVAKTLNEVICVSADKMKILKKLGYSLSLFTTDPAISRIRVVPPSEITWLKMKRRREKEKCCAIVMSGCVSRSEKEAVYGIYKFAASDHSSAVETQAMIEKISARAVLFLNSGVSRPRPARGDSKKVAETAGKNIGSSEEPLVHFDIASLPLAVVPPPPPSVDPLPDEINIVPPPPPPDIPHESQPKVIVERVESSDGSVRFNLDFSCDLNEVESLPPSFEIIGPSIEVATTTVEGSNSNTGHIIVQDTLSLGHETVDNTGAQENTSNSPKGGPSCSQQSAVVYHNSSQSSTGISNKQKKLRKASQNICESPTSSPVNQSPAGSPRSNNPSPRDSPTAALSALFGSPGNATAGPNSLESPNPFSALLNVSPLSTTPSSAEEQIVHGTVPILTQTSPKLQNITTESPKDPSATPTGALKQQLMNLKSSSTNEERPRRKFPPKMFPLNRSDSSSSSSGFTVGLSTIQEESRYVSSSEPSRRISVSELSRSYGNDSTRPGSQSVSRRETRHSRRESHGDSRNDSSHRKSRRSSRLSSRFQKSKDRSLLDSSQSVISPHKSPNLKVPFNLKLYEFFRSSCTNVELT